MNAFLNAVHADHLRLGFRSGGCNACEPISWHDDARAGRLRPSVVGGVPLATDPLTDQPDLVLTRDEPRPGRVPRFDASAHRGRPDRIPVPSGA